VVCKEKRRGGLGVRDARFVNLSLLAKWRWRLLLPGRALWKDVLVAKYGNHIINEVDWSRFNTPSSVSNWWKNIIELDKAVPNRNWLVDSIVRKLGNGLTTSFWHAKWIGDAPLALAFPRLYSLSNHKENMVSDFVSWNGDNRNWCFSWRRNLFQWEEDSVVVLKGLLEPVMFTLEDDCWNWLPDEDGEFSVKSSYKILLKDLGEGDEVEGELGRVLEHIWDSPAPSKVVAFSWQLLYDRIATRNNLEARGVVISERPWECLGCVGKVENSNHLFLHCPSAMLVWLEVFNWIGVPLIIPPSIASLFELFSGVAKNAKIRKGFLMIWHATLWSIWKARNNAILARLKILPCLFYEWNWDPGACLLS
jgi:hypothetical protein